MNEEAIDIEVARFDVDAMELTNSLREVHQEGNYLVGVTEKGVKFRHRVPAGKVLSQNEKGEFVFTGLNHV